MYSKFIDEFEDGKLLLINKPLEWTSFDVIRKLRKVLKIRKMGHAGTLDPLASGMLIICTGKFTKKINDYMAQEKEYTGSITLGAVTATFDRESEATDQKDFSHITAEQIQEATKQFTGAIMQVPPIHSAIKVDGRRVYKLARKGEDIKLEPRAVTISEFEITSIDMPVVNFRVVCSTGTYIRSLANDFGAALGCGGYLSGLVRTRIGGFTLDQAITLEDFEKEVRAQRGAIQIEKDEDPEIDMP